MNDIVLNIKNIFEYDKEEYKKIFIKNIYDEIDLINNMFSKDILIEILKIYKVSKNNNKFKEYNNIFLKIFKILSVEFIDQYEYYLLIFSFFKLIKLEKNILKDIKTVNFNINLIIFYDKIKKYMNLLIKKSNLIKHINDINKKEINNIDLQYIFSSFSKDNSFYFNFNKIFDIFIDSVLINEKNKKFIVNNKNNCKKYYNETTNTIKDLYGLDNTNKYKNNDNIIQKYINILININNIK
jgi:hypothetical protein